MTLCERLNRVPPNFCRLLARRPGGREPMTNVEIAGVSGLGIRVVKRLSKLTRWDGVTLTVAEAFSQACGVDLMRPSEAVDFLRRRRLIYMDRANIRQKQMMDRILGQIMAA